MIQRFLLVCLFYCFLFLPSITAQYVNFEVTWSQFLANEKVSEISKIKKPIRTHKYDYAKYHLIYASTNFCAGDFQTSQTMIDEIEKVGEATYETIPGFLDRYNKLKKQLKASKRIGYLWYNYLEYGQISFEDLENAKAAKTVCDKKTLAKYSMMEAHAYFCEGNITESKNQLDNRVLKLVNRTSLNAEDVEYLPEQIKKMQTMFANLDKLEAAWKKFVATGKSNGFDTPIPDMKCNRLPNLKVLVLQANANICDDGKAKMAEIDKILETNTININERDKVLAKQIVALEEKINSFGGNEELIAGAWQEFLQKDTVIRNTGYLDEYCKKSDMIKSYIIEGSLYTCESGREMYNKIQEIQAKYNPDLDEETTAGVDALEMKIEKMAKDRLEFNEMWMQFRENGDTLEESPSLQKFYCNQMDQVRSWIIKGNLNPCNQGEAYLQAIDKLQSIEKLKFNEEINCSIESLEGRIWDCKYNELVRQAQQETHEERESFGPAAAEIMTLDLNEGGNPCETKVEYAPLNKIGMQLTVTTFLCQDVDLAKMGDPAFYKKIANWIDEQVLKEYCGTEMRCKEDLFIYIEGHTDGNAFRGVTYKNALNIPAGTAFAHFSEEGEMLENTTEEEITKTLKSNMELGLARAWTVKNQLTFMEVPIKLGAYEHPREEKGGEYRKVKMELNITNLMLDFYKKRLAEIVLEAEIGDRPGGC